jgi:hypothetical protein
MSAEEMQFVGLAADSLIEFLDTEEKVRQLREQLTAAQEQTLKQWEAAKRKSQEEASRRFVS